MDQSAIGSYIAHKRREKNLTQELERQKGILYGLVLVTLALPAAHCQGQSAERMCRISSRAS